MEPSKMTITGIYTKTKPLSEEECTESGGHCFVSTGMVLTSNPPQYPEICKHCNKRRTGVPQDSITYY